MIMAISIVYCVIVFVIAFIHRKNKTLEEFIIADKNLGPVVTAASSRATGTSAWLILGYTGFGYAFGLKGVWIAIGEIIAVYLSWYFVAPRFKKLCDSLQANTYTEFLEKATNDNTGMVRAVSSIIICLLIVPYISAQFLGMGRAFEVFFNVPLDYGIWLGMLLIVGYTVIGGYKAVSWSDYIQAIIMWAGILVLLTVLIVKMSSSNATPQIISFPPGFWDIFGEDGLSPCGLWMAISFMSIGLGLFGIPHLFVPFIAARDVGTIRKGAPYACVFTIVLELSALTMGILSRFLITDLADAEQIMPVMSKFLLSPLWSGVLVVVILASIMSTADSLLMSTSTSLIYDLYRNYLRPTAERDKYLITASKICLVMIAISSALLAQGEYALIFWVIVSVWSALTAAFVPSCLSLVFGKQLTSAQVVTSLMIGFLSSVTWRLCFAKATNSGELVVGFCASFLSLYIVGGVQLLLPYLTKRAAKKSI